MTKEYVGSVVSIDCGEVLGTYQGLVHSIDQHSQCMTIINAFRNGVQYKAPKVTISAADILGLKLLKSPPEASSLPKVQQNPRTVANSEHTEAKPAPTAAARCSPSVVASNRRSPRNPHHQKNRNQSPGVRSSPSGHVAQTNGHHGEQVNGFSDNSSCQTGGYHRRRADSGSEQYLNVHANGRKSSTPQKCARGGNSSNGRNGRHFPQDTFSAPVDSFSGEFDFEKNLALFDKQAVFEEIESSGIVELQKANERKQPAKYGCHENVLESGPVQYRQIKVKHNSVGEELLTDSGLVVPCVTVELRDRLLAAAEQAGLSRARQVEMVGRSVNEMVLQLCGGSHRLNPKNAHQRPSVVVLVGAHLTGAYALNAARQLAAHNVLVTVLLPPHRTPADLPAVLHDDIKLLSFTGAKVAAAVKDLPSSPVDIIINGVECSSPGQALLLPPHYAALSQWANACKAPVLALDPPSVPAPNAPAISAKWQLGVALPLVPPAGTPAQIYVCDLSIPKQVYRQVNVVYASPFEHKYVIPLHQNNNA